MPASAPLIVMPVMVIVLLVPMFLSANVAVALVVDSTTSSDPCLSTNVAEPLTKTEVALVSAL